MYSRTIFLSLAALAAAVEVAEPTVVQRDAILPRQTDGGIEFDIGCPTEIIPLADGIPTPPPSLASDLNEDGCSYTGSDSSAYSSYTADLSSWIDENELRLSSFLYSCPQVTGYLGLLPIEICTSEINALVSSYAPAQTTSTDENVGPRETGAAMAALAVAGVVAAML